MILFIHILKKKRKLHCKKTPKCWELINQKQTEKHGFGVFLSYVHGGIAAICIVPCRREERYGLSVILSPKYQRIKKKQNESYTAEEARASQKQNLSLASQAWKQENFMVGMQSSGLKVSCVFFLQVDKKLISLHAHYYCNMHWWRGDNNSSLLFMVFAPVVSEIWVSTGCCVWVQVINAANSPGHALW